MDSSINFSPDSPPSITLNSLLNIFDLSIVVFVAIIPMIEDDSTSFIIKSIDSFFSSGEILRKIGILILKSSTALSTSLISLAKLASLCRSLKFGVFGEEMFIVM